MWSGRDLNREDASNFKCDTTRRKKGWRMKDGEWKMKVRLVAREYKWHDSQPPEHASQRLTSSVNMFFHLRDAQHQILDCLFSHRASGCSTDTSKDGKRPFLANPVLAILI